MSKVDRKTINIAGIYQDPKYRGKYVIVVDKDVFSAKTGKAHNLLLEHLVKKYPDKNPIVMYVPKDDTPILVSLE